MIYDQRGPDFSRIANGTVDIGAYEVQPIVVPAVTGINPTIGLLAGGTTVTITGTGFTGATAVLFRTAQATGVTVDSDTVITAMSPAGTGVVDVTVAGPNGTSAISAADKFTYSATPPAAPTPGDRITPRLVPRRAARR